MSFSQRTQTSSLHESNLWHRSMKCFHIGPVQYTFTNMHLCSKWYPISIISRKLLSTYQLNNILILIYYHSHDNNRLGTFRITFLLSLRFYYQVALNDIRKNNYSWKFYLYKTYNILRKYDMKCLFINWLIDYQI